MYNYRNSYFATNNRTKIYLKNITLYIEVWMSNENFEKYIFDFNEIHIISIVFFRNILEGLIWFDCAVNTLLVISSQIYLIHINVVYRLTTANQVDYILLTSHSTFLCSWCIIVIKCSIAHVNLVFRLFVFFFNFVQLIVSNAIDGEYMYIYFLFGIWLVDKELIEIWIILRTIK